MELTDLKHVRRTLPEGGEVIVVDTGALIGPEQIAMLQALHSRSLGGVRDHLSVLEEKGAEGFMKTYYVGYGHASIGDCGSAVVFIEGVSMLDAKAVQDHRLYSGQEASTRYIDFREQPFMDPLGSTESHEQLEALREFFVRNLPIVRESVLSRFPMEEGEKKNWYERAISARAFDIMRGFLPAGATTNLAWHSNLRQFRDHLQRLRNHPLQSVRSIGLTIEDALHEAFPSSFNPGERSRESYDLQKQEERERYEAIRRAEEYVGEVMAHHHMLRAEDDWPLDFRVYRDGIDRDCVSDYSEILSSRPGRGVLLPVFVGDAGTVTFQFTLDFGSFRDIQRHRAPIQRIPLVSWNLGFHEWYLNELPDSVRSEAEELLDKHEDWLSEVVATRELRQYYVPMGYRQPCELTVDIPGLVYLVELRAKSDVHPTLQLVAGQMAEWLETNFTDCGLKLHLDPTRGRFDTRRGKQTIERVD